MSGVLIRLSALAAILAGFLRAAASFISETARGVGILYLSIDVLMVIGVIGINVMPRGSRTVAARVSLALLLGGLAVLIARDVGILPAGAYAPGALIFSLGLDLFAIDSLRTRRFSPWIPIAWIFSTIVGPLGYFLPGWRLLFALSGLIFGITFAAAGVEIWLWALRPVPASKS